MLGIKPYNYRRFTRDMVLKDFAASRLVSAGPQPGERAPDFELRTLDGDRFHLSDFEGDRNVVLTFGSATCPMTAGSIRGLNDLCDDYSGEGVEFLFVYVREAHPGDAIPAHERMEDKIAASELLREEEDIDIPIAVDDLKGTTHRNYGKLPNPTYVVDKSGRVAFRSLWSRPGEVRAALEDLLARQEERGVEHAIVHGGDDVSMPMSHGLLYSHRALERGGREAIHDFREAMGAPGRVALATSRVIEPVALHPWRVLSGAMIASGVIAGALFAGHKLRQKRLGFRSPYDLHVRPRATASGEDYEAVGI
jgi:peroxiredoxin